MDITIYDNQKQISFYVIITLLLAFFLRIYKLDFFPIQINQDELSNIYDGYCISETGADRWGEKWPLILKGFGDFDNRPPLYAYLSAISIKLFGYSIISGRLPAVVIGLLSLVILFLTAQKIGGKMYGLICLFLASLSPWHILFSRIAHEGASLPPFFIITTLYLWITCKESNFKIRNILLLGLIVGLATNAYQATKVTSILLSVFFGIRLFNKSGKDNKKLMYFIIAVGIGALPQIIASIFYSERFFSRANDQLIGFSFSFHYFYTIISNFLANLSPNYLFFSFGEFNNLSVGRFLWIEIALFYFGLYLFYRLYFGKLKVNILLIYFLLAISLIPSAITKDSPHALRSSAGILIYPLFSGATIVYLLKKLNYQKYKYAFLVVLGIILFNGFYNIRVYLKNPELQKKGAQYGQVAMYGKMKEFGQSYENIYIQHFGAFQYLFVANYCNISPAEYQGLPKVFTKDGWYHFSRLGKYHFLSENQIKLANQVPNGNKNLLVLLEKTNKYPLLDSLILNCEKIYYYKN